MFHYPQISLLHTSIAYRKLFLNYPNGDDVIFKVFMGRLAVLTRVVPQHAGNSLLVPVLHADRWFSSVASLSSVTLSHIFRTDFTRIN
jgi:hypothetical protein